jgi:Sulfatase-modifying factor enzyme 1
MNRSMLLFASMCAVATLGTPAGAGDKTVCSPDSVAVGLVCVDKYEASVWQLDPSNTSLIQKVRKGKATLADLAGGGAIQRGVNVDDYPCADTGSDCSTIYAVSISGVQPSAYITWFQAQQACLNSRKRLLHNDEWQGAAAGTPEPFFGGPSGSEPTGACISFSLAPTGSLSQCVSRWGVFDMVGNVSEWVADWIPGSNGSAPYLFGSIGINAMSVNPGTQPGAAALVRGGPCLSGTGIGPNYAVPGLFWVVGINQPSTSLDILGFRCGR